jgi:hypothetical protein
VYNRAGELKVHRPLNFVPVLAPEGAVVPLDGAWRPKSGSPNPDSLELLVVVGADGSFTLTEDDGSGTHVDDCGFALIDDAGEESSDTNNVKFATTPIVYKQSAGVLKIGPVDGDTSCVPKSREWKVRLLAYTASPKDISCFTTSPHANKHHAKPLSHTLTTEPNGTLICLGSVSTSNAIIINLLPSHSSSSSHHPQLDIVDPLPRIRDIIDKAGIDMDAKWDIWNTVDNRESVLNKVRALQGKGMKKELLDAVLEVLLADERYADRENGGGEF